MCLPCIWSFVTLVFECWNAKLAAEAHERGTLNRIVRKAAMLSRKLAIIFSVALTACGGGGASSVTGPPTLLASVNAAQTFALMGQSYVQLLGGQMLLSSVPEAGGVSGSGTIVGPSTLGASSMRFGKITDPLDSTRQVFYHAAMASDPVTFGHLGRVEIGLDTVAGAMQKSGSRIGWPPRSTSPRFDSRRATEPSSKSTTVTPRAT
jgi:hypothetical protein